MEYSAKESSSSKSAEDVRPDVAGLLRMVERVIGTAPRYDALLNWETDALGVLYRCRDALQAKDADRADAERYRWFRSTKNDIGCCFADDKCSVDRLLAHEQLDAAIDAAREVDRG